MSRPRREPEDKSLRAAANSPPDTLGRLSLSPQLAIAVALGAGQGVLVHAGTKQMHSLTWSHFEVKKNSVRRHPGVCVL